MKRETEAGFRERVEALVAQIPSGRVMTYGQLAALCGNAGAARVVGGIAHFGDPDLPWQRVVNKQGGLAAGYPGGRSGHKQVMEAEGFSVSEAYAVDVTKLLWWPKTTPLIVLVGETASGKTDLAIKLAQQFDGEIICADSWTVRREADIGTAKPTAAQRAKAKHHLLDVVAPYEDFTAAVFKRLAKDAIKDIAERAKLPIIVGGTGLYVDGVVYDYGFLPAGDRGAREALNKLSIDRLLAKINDMGLVLGDIDTKNKRRLIRLIEVDGALPTKKPMRANTLMLGLKTDRLVLENQVEQRVDNMLAAGLEDEVGSLAKRYGWDCEALKGISYAQWREYFLGNESREEVRRKIIKDSLDLAKRQRTWFKRNKGIQWLETPVKWSTVEDLVTTFLKT